MARSHTILTIALTFFMPPAVWALDFLIWRPTQPLPPDAVPIECVKRVPYYSGKDADSNRHSLDLYLPKGHKDFPVVVFVHGGAWMAGDNCCCGLYSSIGEYLASRGIGAVLPNYRLSPWVRHPEHMKDLARAWAWTKAHIGEYGGRSDRMFAMGHSAGGHMVALLATDERYLQAEGLDTKSIRGVIAISGVYRIPEGNYEFALGGSGPDGLRLADLFALRGAGQPLALLGPGLPLRLNVFGPVFGDEPRERAGASPLNHVRANLPPFLIFSAEHDLPMLGAMADELHAALKGLGCDSTLVKVPARNHNSVMFLAMNDSDPVAGRIVEFVRRNTTSAK